MKLIVGLGNPGKEFIGTRHNAGFMVIDHIAKTLGVSLNQELFNGCYAKFKLDDEDVVIAKPLTFMNLSGDFVAPFMHYFKIPTENLLVVFDDINFPVGKIKVKPKGSAGGQNGVKDIIKKLGTEDFKRIKVGIGQNRPGQDLKAFVLSRFTTTEQEALTKGINTAAAATYDFLTKDFAWILSRYNQ